MFAVAVKILFIENLEGSCAERAALILIGNLMMLLQNWCHRYRECKRPTEQGWGGYIMHI